MTSQHWFRQWLGITRVNVDPDLCHHMASLGHNELTNLCQNKMAAIFLDSFSQMKGFFFTLIFISLKFVPKGPIKKKSALVQAMAWCLIGNEPLPETMKTKICWCIGTKKLMRCSAKLSFALCYVQLHFFWGSSWKSMECFDSNKS